MNYYLYGLCRRLSIGELYMLHMFIKQQIGEYKYGKPVDKRLETLLKDLEIVKKEQFIKANYAHS